MSDDDVAEFSGTGEGSLNGIVGVALLQKVSCKMRTKSVLQFISIVLHPGVISVGL